MPEYQFAESNGTIVTVEYDKSNYLTSEQVLQSLRSAFSLFPYDVRVSMEEGYDDVFVVDYDGEEEIGFKKLYLCCKGTTPGGRSGLKDEQRIQPKAKYLNYVHDKNQGGNKAVFLGIYTRDEQTVLCAWKVAPSSAESQETPISKQIKITSIAKAMREGFVQQSKGKGEYACAFKPEFLYFYLRNSEWLHTGTVSEYTDHQIDDDNQEELNKDNIADNILLYGVPGCGKSHTIKEKYCNDDARMERAVFHPDYTYSDFVGQILPKVLVNETGNKSITYEFEAGPFTRILRKAKESPAESFFLVVEEINRGNAPAIFGDIFQLLDRDDNGESEYGISNEAIAEYVYGDKNQKVKIPSNLYILATMNTSDQNVFTLDTAFKRRWSMKRIENNIDACKYGGHEVCGSGISWRVFAKTINNMIIEVSTENLSNEDNRLGAYFVKASELDNADKFGEKVLMYLWNDAFKYDHEKVFKPEYHTLDELIDGFKDVGFDIFIDKGVFITDDFTELSSNVETKEVEISKYLEGKNEQLLAYYNTLRDLVMKRLPDIRESSTKSLQYAAWRSDNINKSSFADIQFQSDRLLIYTEIPRNPANATVGEEIQKDNHHNHYYKIIYNDANINEIVEIIIESYEQLKKGDVNAET